VKLTVLSSDITFDGFVSNIKLAALSSSFPFKSPPT